MNNKKPSAIRPADAAKGAAGETRFQQWLEASEVGFFNIEQNPPTMPKHLRGKFKRADYIVGILDTGQLAFEVKAKTIYPECQSALNLDPWSASNVDPSFALSRADDGERSPRRSWSGLRSRGECGAGCQPRCLKRQLSLPVSTMSQWWVRRSRSAVVILASPKTVGHSPKARLVVTMTEVRS